MIGDMRLYVVAFFLNGVGSFTMNFTVSWSL